VIGTDINYKSDRAKQFNVMLEKEFAGNVLTAGYIGAIGDRLQQGVNYNLAPPAATGAVDPRRPYFSQYPRMANATVLENVARSKYDAAQFVFTRRSRGGLTFTTHYTLAHAQEWRRTPWNFSIEETGDTPNFDVRHRWVATGNYELPFGRNLTGVAHGFLSAWQVNATAYLQSGVAYAITNATSRTLTGGTDRPLLNGDPTLSGSDQSIQRWFDTSKFSLPAPGESGNIGLATLHGPAQKRMDFSIFKDLSLGGSQKIQLRAEIYNLTNYASFGLPDAQFGSTGFGTISSTGNSIPRQMQFGIKYLF
jgi:hypothetical protein